MTEETGVEFAFERVMVEGEAEQGHHLTSAQVHTLLHRAWHAYLTEGLGLPQDVVYVRSAQPFIKDVHLQYDAEADAGEHLVCAVRAASRTNRSFVLESEVRRRADGQRLAHARTVYVTAGPGGAVPVPDVLWDAVQALEGRLLPAP